MLASWELKTLKVFTQVDGSLLGGGPATFSLHYLPGGKNFPGDALSRLPQYNSIREDVNSIIPSNEVAAPAFTRMQGKLEPKVTDDLTYDLKVALAGDDLFTHNKNDVTVHDGHA